jgi:ATP-dependent helicase/nuclease subunit A
MKMLPDSAARQRALDTSISFIVQAPAGSGKTELLIQRYLKLLETVDTPDAVVAITFTRKAAGEMRSRVLDALRNAETGAAASAPHERLTFDIACKILEKDRQQGWHILKNPAQMRIETIDALCASITRRMPWLARFGAMPEISEKADDLYREAARNTLRHVEDDQAAVTFLLLHLDNDFAAAERLIAQMLERRDQWLRHTGANPDFARVRVELERSLQRLILGELQSLRDEFDEDVAREIVAVCQLEQFPAATLDDLALWNSVAELLLTSNGQWRKRVSATIGFPPNHPLKPRLERLLGRLQTEDRLLDLMCQFRELPSPTFTDSQWQAMESAVSVLTLAVAELQLVFRERSRVDFAELSIRASEALGGRESPTDLALALGHRIEHLLVDEFQDTSFTQFELLEKLTTGWEPGDGRTLFLVGDPMQSIYRFRQAEVSLFLKARQDGINAIRLEPLALNTNFRSDDVLVEWVNQVFSGILPPQEDIESGAVAYSPSVAGTTREGAAVDVQGCVDENDQAARVIELVRSSGEARTAILVRARTHLPAIVALLKLHKIRFQAIEIDQLGERPVIEDLIALTLALLHPGDRVSWLAILRAPWCGLRLDDLHALAANDHHAAIWDLLHREPLQLSNDGVARVRRILPILAGAIKERGRLPLRDWIEGTWMRFGGPACVQDETALEDAGAYFDLLEGLAEGGDLFDFSWFRDQVNALFAQPDANAGDRLQLMTIHKAKGLEFDRVILPGLDAPTRREDQRLLLWLEQRGELLLAPVSQTGLDTDPIYRYLARIDNRKNDLETARLLYVAATRARSRINLLGVVKRKEDGAIAEPASGSFLRLLWPTLAPAFANVSPIASELAVNEPRMIRRVPAGWRVPEPPPPVTWTPREIESATRASITFAWVSERLRYVGTALHAMLQRVAREGVDAWDESAVRSRRANYETVLANLGVAPSELNDAARQVEAGLLKTLRDPTGRWILGAHVEAKSELQLTGLIEGKLHEIVIDRTFIDESGVRWIIDYKTSAHEGGDLQTFLDNQKERYREQLERYARLMVQRDDRPIRLGLYFPLLSEWREWAAPVVLRKQASLFEI